MGDKDYVDGIKKLLWSTWEKSTLSDDDYNRIEIELLKKYEDTKDVEYIFLLSELNAHKMNLCKNKVYNYSLQGIKDNYDYSSLHDNYVLSQMEFRLTLRNVITIKL